MEQNAEVLRCVFWHTILKKRYAEKLKIQRDTMMQPSHPIMHREFKDNTAIYQ